MSIYGNSSFGLSGLTFGISRLGQHRAQISESLERLSTGKRINRASDDPSGMMASNTLHARKLSIEKQLAGFEREGAMLGAQEGALSVLADMAIQLNELTVSAANTGAYSEEEIDGFIVQAESIVTGFDTINATSMFNGEQVLTGFSSANLGSVQFETVDPDTGETVLREGTLTDLPELLRTNPELAQELAQQVNDRVNNRRGAIGNRLNAMESQGAALTAELEGTTDALSSIEDADFAQESAKLVRSQILEQATIQTMLTQRNQIESMLDLLTGSTEGSKSKSSAPKLLG